MFKFEDCYAGYVNLSYRKDRLIHMEGQLAAAGIVAERTEGINTRMRISDAVDGVIKMPAAHETMFRRTPGAIGCYLSQMNVMKKALDLGKSAFVMEDDLIFCSDIQDRFRYIENFINNQDPEFDVFWLGGTFHIGPPHWHTGTNPLLPHAFLRRDAQRTSDQRILRTFGCFSTHAYIVNIKSIENILNMLNEQMSTSIGIDFSFIRMQPDLKTYSFVPGCVKQMDNQSDIGSGMTIYSGFSRLNGTEENSRYWWQDKMEDFDPQTFDWKEANV